MPQRVLIADDHRLLRAGIRALLEKYDEFEIVGEAGDGREALELVAQHHPDVVLLDLTMPSLHGLDALPRIKRQSPETKVIILSMHANEEYVVQALRSGVSGYVIKDAAVEELRRALRTVAAGETFLSPRISKQTVESYLESTNGVHGPLKQLTPRQREVLQLIAEGRNTKEVADTLQVSVKTVEAHRLQIMQRLGIHDVPGLVRFAIRIGLVSPET